MVQKMIFDLPIGPGQYTEQSERGAQGRWYSMDKVRFRKGLAEKIGGWVQLQPQFLGTARRLKDWSSLDGERWAAIATDVKLYLWQDSTLYDITPLRRTATLSGPFATTNLSNVVVVTDVAHGAQTGDYVTFSNTIASGGITVEGEYQIQTILTNDTYEIVDDETATSTGSGGGGLSVLAEYQISTGEATAIAATGYGAGPYGAEAYGTARTGSTFVVGIRTWSLDTWGEDLLASPNGGAIYWWDRSSGTGQRAIALGGDAPPNNEYMIVSQRDRHIIALGAFDFFNNKRDPLLIRWSSTEDLNDWVPSSTNTAGDLRLYSGSKIVTGVRSRLETVIFTDVSVHTLPFVGGFDVFGLNIVGENVSILGPNAAVPIDHRVLFMAESDFYLYDGVVKVLPCDVRNLVYGKLNTVQRDKVYGGLNREFNEVWWFYPSYDTDAWVQQAFDVGLPTGYSRENSSDVAPNLYADTLFQADFEGVNGATTYTEESSYAAVATFNGATQISTTSPILDTSSLDLGSAAASEYVQFPIQLADLPDWNGTGQYLTAEFIFRLDTLHTSLDKTICIVGDSDAQIFRLAVNRSGGNSRLRAGFANSGGLSPIVTINAGTNYVCIVEADNTGGAGNCTERVWFGEQGGTISLIDTTTGLTAKDPTGLSRIIDFGGSSGLFGTDGHVDHVRITNSTTGRYGTASTVTIDDPYPTSDIPGGPSDVGYTYVFNSSGYTEVNATAQNAYPYTYYLTNDEPILTPMEGEYAVELDWGALSDVDAGVLFLRQDLAGDGNTAADTYKGFMFVMNPSGAGTLSIIKKDVDGSITTPDNQVSNSVDFTVTTGSAPALDQKYILTVQVDTPQVTCYIDGVQVFQFNLSAQELLDHTGGSSGFYVETSASADAPRFYNHAVGPVGVLTATDFDISPIEVNRYVAFNYEEGSWVTGNLTRTAWADRSPLLEKPYAAGTDGYLYQHETGTDNNGVAMPAHIESFDMEIPEAGEYLMHIDQLIPDFLKLEGDVDVYLKGRKYPQAPEQTVKGPYPVSNSTRKISTRIRARQVAVRVESNDTGDRWRFGTWRGRAGPHGKRG